MDTGTEDSAQSAHDLRVFVAVQVLGLCAALEAGVMTPTTAHRWLFRPGLREQLVAMGACSGCLGMVDIGQAATTGCVGVSPKAVTQLREMALAVLRHSSSP